MKPQVECTLLDLVQALNKFSDDDHEVAAIAASLINTGRVRLCGNFAGAKIKLPASLSTFPSRLWPTLLNVNVAGQ
jgi:hypothetical protein